MEPSDFILKPSTIVFRLDKKFAKPRKAKVDAMYDHYERYYEEFEAETIELKPGDFILARTYERIAIDNTLAMFIEGRSTLSRLGISVTQTAMTIEAGHGFPSLDKPKPRKIVLEIHNAGPFTVTLHYKMPIAKGIVVELRTPAEMLYDATGKYAKEVEEDTLIPRC